MSDTGLTSSSPLSRQFRLTYDNVSRLPYIKSELLAEAFLKSATHILDSSREWGGPFSYHYRLAAEFFGLAGDAYRAASAAAAQGLPHAQRRANVFEKKAAEAHRKMRDALAFNDLAE